MKALLLFSFLMSFSAMAEDTTFHIDQFTMTGDHGNLISKEFSIKSDTGEIGFKSDDEFNGEVTLKDKVMLIQGTNGMFIKAAAPVDITTIPETSITNAVLINQKDLLSLQAGSVSTSVSNFHLDTSNLLFRCESGQCQASATQLVVDNSTKITSPVFTCPQEKCIEHFKLTIHQLDNNLKFSVKSIEARSIIDLNDVSEIDFTREGGDLNFAGKVKIPLFGKVGFVLRAGIVGLTKERLDLEIRKVAVGKYLSITELTVFLAKKFLGSKSYTISGNVISINLK